ncbi:MAG TPA: excalibur calcium-binding domain-containing protein [Arenimonas sp.]|nr:excalibur calcium-binding domain-containing protein [Arenimonas sp.]HPO23630.1 excalibur calcium-binding domain-containing protein [Arenimonas sp.]
MNTLKPLIFLALACAALQAQAHGGRTNAEGCHNDRKNGGYHCHNGNSSSTATRSSFNNTSSSVQSKQSGKTYYPNCAAVRAAGAAPLRRGEPGYASHLDRDNDGVACE